MASSLREVIAGRRWELQPQRRTQAGQCLLGSGAVRSCLGAGRKLTSLFFFGTRRNQLFLILNGQAWKSSLPTEKGGGEKQAFRGGSGQGVKEAGLCWKLCSLAKTRWKDQLGLYELVPSFFWVCFPSSAKQVGPLGCRADISQGPGK